MFLMRKIIYITYTLNIKEDLIKRICYDWYFDAVFKYLFSAVTLQIIKINNKRVPAKKYIVILL